MLTANESKLSNRLCKVSKILSTFVGLIGVSVIIGWVYNIDFLKNIHPNFISMKMNTAIAFVLVSLCLLLQQTYPYKNRIQLNISKVIALLVFLFGFTALIEYTFDLDLLIDNLFITQHHDYPFPRGRMAPITAVGFVLTGLTLLLRVTKNNVLLVQILTFFIGCIGLFVISGYAYHINTNIQITSWAYSSIHAAYCFVFISLAIYFMNPKKGISRIFISDSEAGKLLRLLLPFTVIVPVFLEYVRLLGESYHLYDLESGMAIYSTLTIMTLLVFILITSLTLMNAHIKRQQMQNQLKKALNDLKHSNYDLEHFAHIASHDLHQPLRMVSSYLQLIMRRYKENITPEMGEYMQFAIDGSQRMEQMITGLLTYSRVQTKGQDFKEIDCEKVIRQALENLNVLINEQHAEITHDPLPMVMGDEMQLVQLFQNLICNAIKFHGKEMPRVHVSVERDEDYYIFHVSDNGIGIPENDMKKIFVIFQRSVGSEYEGSGIGLAVCKRIIQRHHGKIWIDSVIGKGSTFSFTLPMLST